MRKNLINLIAIGLCIGTVFYLSSQITIEFCKRGDIGHCAVKADGSGFACVTAEGTKDCKTSFFKQISL